MEIPYDGNMLPGQSMFGCVLLSQEMCKPIWWYWKVVSRQLHALTWHILFSKLTDCYCMCYKLWLSMGYVCEYGVSKPLPGVLKIFNYLYYITSTHWPIGILFFQTPESELFLFIVREDSRFISEINPLKLLTFNYFSNWHTNLLKSSTVNPPQNLHVLHQILNPRRL